MVDLYMLESFDAYNINSTHVILSGYQNDSLRYCIECKPLSLNAMEKSYHVANYER